jgi:hypothetical protein
MCSWRSPAIIYNAVGSLTRYRQLFDRVVQELADFAGLV